MEADKLPLADPEFDPTTLPGVGPALAETSAGNVAGYWAPRAALVGSPTLEPLRKNSRALVSKLGLSIFAGTGDKIVIYNPSVLKPDEVKQIDKHGALEQVFQPLPLDGGGAAEPAPAPAAAQAAPAPVAPPSPAAGASNARRITQTKPQEPAKMAIPGGGSILNGLLKRPA